MSEIKIYGTLVNSTTDKAIVEAEQVSGGFMALSTSDRLNLTSALKVENMIVYDTTASLLYQFIDGDWVEFSTHNPVRCFLSKTLIDYSTLSYTTKDTATSYVTLTNYIKTIWGLQEVDLHLLLLAYETVSDQNRLLTVQITKYSSNYYLKCIPVLTNNNIFLFNSDVPFINSVVLSSGTSFVDFFTQFDNIVFGTTAGTSYEGSSGLMDLQNIATLLGYFLNGVANKAASDKLGNLIDTTYATNSELSKKTVDVHLVTDEEKIWLFSDEELTALTYELIKAITETETNNVYLTNGYYSFHNKYKYDKSISGLGEDAIGFIGSTQLNGNVYSYRIAINENNLVTADEIQVANQSGIPTKTSQLTNDSNFAVDANYVHTDNNYTNAEKEKLALAVTVDDEELEASIPIDADTLDGYHASHFDDAISAEVTRAKDVEDTKVDKVSGKLLSTNDYTDGERTKLSGIASNATKVEASPTNGHILINGGDTTVYTEALYTVHDGLYKHITVTDDSVSDGSTTFKKYDDTAVKTLISNEVSRAELAESEKVDKVDGKGLSTNDFTTDEKTKLATLLVISVDYDSDNNLVITFDK